MLKRVIVAVIAIPVLLLIILAAPLWVFGLLVGLIAGGCAWEFLRCAETESPLRFRFVAAVIAALIPLGQTLFPGGRTTQLLLFLLFAYMMCELMISFHRETTLDFETVPVVLLGGGIMPVLLSSLVHLGQMAYGHVYVILPFVVAFSCDSGAYFVGCAVGRHKLAPRLSPHKTLEGSAGGFAGAVVLTLVYGLILKLCGFEVRFSVLAADAFLGALACQLGDLSFSAIKRLCGVKDYGTLIPGHGGVLDRFDSMFWTAALIDLLVSWVPVFTK